MPKGLTVSASRVIFHPYEKESSCIQTSRLTPEDWSFVREVCPSWNRAEKNVLKKTHRSLGTCVQFFWLINWAEGDWKGYCPRSHDRARQSAPFIAVPWSTMRNVLYGSWSFARSSSRTQRKSKSIRCADVWEWIANLMQNSLCNRCGLRFAKDQRSSNSLMTQLHQIKIRMAISNLLNADTPPQVCDLSYIVHVRLTF